jgi:acetyltransferase-like isoleucine patch superfamily enzyme
MQKIATLIYKAIWRILTLTGVAISHLLTWVVLYCNNVRFKEIHTKGVPFVKVARGGKCTIGNNFRVNNTIQSNPIGRVQRCILVVGRDADLSIGNNVGMSSTAIVAHKNIQIGNFVQIGGGVCIYDTDFHSLDPEIRQNKKTDREMKNCAPVIISDNVFIGAHSTVLKGVTIGENAIIGACSVVTKNIQANEIWAGNPAKFIKKLGNV